MQGHQESTPPITLSSKRSSDEGRDIPDAHELFKALTETNTTVKLFFVKSENVENALEKMPTQIPAVPSTMRIHQVITLAPRELVYRDVSCMWSTQKQLDCKCFNTQHFSFSRKVPTAAPQPASEGKPQPVKEIQWGSPGLLGQWCMLRYDEDLYPGIILNTDEMHVQVKCMHRVGSNRFFWPVHDDILWYLFDDVLEIIPPPQPVTSCHVEILKEAWDRLSG
ncbi:UNVERIFIED_CONTAM: hypothetical protein FKN15_059111 [Acipenser sinensis]